MERVFSLFLRSQIVESEKPSPTNTTRHPRCLPCPWVWGVRVSSFCSRRGMIGISVLVINVRAWAGGAPITLQDPLQQSGSCAVWQRSCRSHRSGCQVVCHNGNKCRSHRRFARFVSTSLRQFLWRLEADSVKCVPPNKACSGWWGVCAFFKLFLALGFSRFDNDSTLRPHHR